MPFFRKVVRSDHLKRFELRFELCELSGFKEWFIRLAKGEMRISVKVCSPNLLPRFRYEYRWQGVDRGNKKILYVQRLPPIVQCTLTLEGWLFSSKRNEERIDVECSSFPQAIMVL